MQRRRFLHLTAAGTCAIGLPLALPRTDAAPLLRPLARPGLLDLFGDEETVRAIGRAYRRQVREEDDPETLGEKLRKDARRTSGSDLTARLERRVRQDFAEGRTVVLDGWVLAVTEARQCALFSLLPP